MKTLDDFNQWLDQNIQTALDVDCAITVMLKIIDGKCKMNEPEKLVMRLLYFRLRHRECRDFTPDVHAFIDHALIDQGEDMKMKVYEKRLMAETMIARPRMKAFKAKIRENGLFDFVHLAKNQQAA